MLDPVMDFDAIAVEVAGYTVFTFGVFIRCHRSGGCLLSSHNMSIYPTKLVSFIGVLMNVDYDYNYIYLLAPIMYI